MLLIIIASLAFAGSAQADVVGADPVGEPVVVPEDGLVETQPVSPPKVDPEPKVGGLYLWLSRDGRKVRQTVVRCRGGCPDARWLLLASLPRPGQVCLPRFFGLLRAGGFYEGEKIGPFSQTDTCRMKQWRTIAPVYRKHFR